MTDVSVERIWEDVSDKVGDDLRVVTRYKGTDFETRMREDVRAQYTPDEDQTVVDNTIINQLSFKETETVFKTGQLHGLVRIFDEAWILSWPDRLHSKSGVIISIQRDGTASMNEIEWCLQYLNDQIDPLLP